MPDRPTPGSSRPSSTSRAIGVDVKRVNYRSAFDALNEMKSGKIDFFFTDATSALGQIASGKYRALAVTSGKTQ